MTRWSLLLIFVFALASESFAEASRHWVFFSDKGVVTGQEQRALDQAMSTISERSIERRLRNNVPVIMLW
ncbi:MAG: hypothetical protein IPK53_15040 [bacterium]|nr:hypothetical protein [bacterium]